jgi:hypothetical protein
VLRAVQFDDQACVGAEEIDLHFPIAVKRDRQFSVQTKTARRFSECLQTSK